MAGSDSIEKMWGMLTAGLRTFILSRVRNDSDADDILQNTYLKIHDNLHQLKDGSKIKPWIYQIARNLIADHYRDASRQLKIRMLAGEPAGSYKSGRYMDTAVDDMIKMMEELSPEYCEALCLTEIGGMSGKEYARLKGLSHSGAKSRVQRARMALKEMLLKCCHYQFDKYGTVFDIQPACCCCCNKGSG
jgi:RNA polymerase sigma-70 factor, ECF subfamily